MKRHLLRAALAVAALGFCAVVAGCLSASQVAADIRANRERRCAEWLVAKEGADASRPLLKGPLSLQECVRTALVNSRQMQQALLDRQKAAARLTEAWAEAYPKLNLTATYTRLDEVASFTAGPETVTIGDKNNYTLAAVIRQPLFRGGAVSAGVRAAVLYSLLVEEQVRGVQQAVVFNARKAYYDVRLAMALERASAEALEVAKSHLVDIRKNYEAGVLSAFDVLRAEVEVKSLTAQNVQDQNRLHLAVSTLLNVMGVCQESEVELTEELSYSPLPVRLDEALQAAFVQNPEILQQELIVKLQQEAVNAARAGYFPELDAVFTESYSKPDPHSQTRNEWGDAWSVGLSLTWPLFDGFRTSARVRQAKADLEKSRVALRDTEERVVLAAKQAIWNLEDASKAVLSQEANVQKAKEALRLAELGFREGIRKQVEVLDARRAVTAAQASYAQAVYQHELARLQYEQATGALAPPEGSEFGLWRHLPGAATETAK